MADLKIDPEFRDKIPPLTEAEFKQLEENILADGEVREPIVIWNGTILDGHNRWKIIQKHPEIPYKTKPMNFSDKWAAIVWMCRNQLGRRSITGEQRAVLIAQEYDAQKKTVSNPSGKNQFAEVGGENLHQAKNKTRAIVAKTHGITEGAVKAAVEFSHGLDSADEVAPGFRDSVLTGTIKAPKSIISSFPKMDEPERKKAVQAIQNGERVQPKEKPPIPPMPKNTGAEFDGDALIEQLNYSTKDYCDTFKLMLQVHSTLLQDEVCKKNVIAVLSEAEAAIEKLKGLLI